MNRRALLGGGLAAIAAAVAGVEAAPAPKELRKFQWGVHTGADVSTVYGRSPAMGILDDLRRLNAAAIRRAELDLMTFGACAAHVTLEADGPHYRHIELADLHRYR